MTMGGGGAMLFLLSIISGIRLHAGTRIWEIFSDAHVYQDT